MAQQQKGKEKSRQTNHHNKCNIYNFNLTYTDKKISLFSMFQKYFITVDKQNTWSQQTVLYQ